MERDYHKLFFEKYSINNKLSPSKQPVVSFTLDEAIMESNYPIVFLIFIFIFLIK